MRLGIKYSGFNIYTLYLGRRRVLKMLNDLNKKIESSFKRLQEAVSNEDECREIVFTFWWYILQKLLFLRFHQFFQLQELLLCWYLKHMHRSMCWKALLLLQFFQLNMNVFSILLRWLHIFHRQINHQEEHCYLE